MTVRTVHLRRARGFTMVEAIATLTVLGVLASVSANLIYTATGSYRDAATRAEICDELSVAMERVARRLTGITRDASAAPELAPTISMVTPSSISWDGDCSLSLSGSQLRLVEGGGTARTLLENVTAFSVAGYDESNVPLAATLAGPNTRPIRRVLVQLTVQRNGVTQTLRTKVFIRSTMAGAKIG